MSRARIYRFSFRDSDSDVIAVIERCPKSLRNELIATAIRFLEKNKHLLILNDSQPEGSHDGKTPDTEAIDFTSAFGRS